MFAMGAGETGHGEVEGGVFPPILGVKGGHPQDNFSDCFILLMIQFT